MDLQARRAAEEEAARAAAQAAVAVAVACSPAELPAAPPPRPGRSRAPLMVALGLAFLAAFGMGVAAERLLGAHGRGGVQAGVSAD